ncbi:hypothetical protein FACS1894186_4540 [Alphaproteobacteria bacterium]|nr:hypothetical protein FACS1894186_4540 [Alphaproteobacteria bacterium]
MEREESEISVKTTPVFDKWHEKIRKKDSVLYLTIALRLRRLAQGDFGDHKEFGGIFELRIFSGGGVRIYCKLIGNTLVVLLCGGKKDTQQGDIAKAKELAEEVVNDYETERF